MISCFNMENKNKIYETKGFPRSDQSFSYMYFKSEKEGYLFGVYKKYLNLDEVIKDPEIRSEIEFERNIYKTVDGGHNWEKIEAFFNGKQSISYAKNGIIKNGNIYIGTINISGNDRFIDVFSLDKNRIIQRKKSEFDVFVLLQGDKKEIYSLVADRNRRNNKIIAYNTDLTIVDSMNINSMIFLKGSIIDKTIYIINSNKGKLHFSSIDEKGTVKEIDLPIYPDYMTQKSSADILLVGNDKLDDNKIKFVNYDINTRENEVIKEVEGYSIVSQFQSNDKVIVAFLGNIKGHFVKYDLIYSQDQGKTWTAKELEDSYYVSPSCLVDNIIYIYSGGRIQKIILDNK